MADEPFDRALNFVCDVLSSRRAAGMRASASSGSLRALLDPLQPSRSVAVAGIVVPDEPAVSEVGIGALVPISPDSGGSVGAPPAVHAEPRPGTSRLPDVMPLAAGQNALQRLEALRTEAMKCSLCPDLAAQRAQVVFGSGSVEAALMIIGEAPGAEEDQEGRPFAGEAGELLEKMLKVMGLSMGEVYVTNVLKCHPQVPGEPGALRAPQASELERCLPYLATQISIVQPKVIVAMGAGAMHALFGGRTPMGSLRSQWHALRGIPVMPTFHPRYLLRNDDLRERRKVWEDLMQVMERLGLAVTARHRSFFLKGA